MSIRRLAPLALPLLLAACASTSELDETRARLDQVNREATSRLSQIESRISNERLLEMVGKVDAMQAEVAKLRGDNEMLQYRIGELAKRQNDLYADIDQRLARFEGGSSAQPAAGAASAGGAPAADPVQAAYDAALAPLRARDFAAAIVQLKAFADAHPERRRRRTPPTGAASRIPRFGSTTRRSTSSAASPKRTPTMRARPTRCATSPTPSASSSRSTRRARRCRS